MDLFGEVDEEEVERERKRRQEEADAKKKSGKPELIAKSNLILDVKPWDDKTGITIFLAIIFFVSFANQSLRP